MIKHAVWFNVKGRWVLRIVYLDHGHIALTGWSTT